VVFWHSSGISKIGTVRSLNFRDCRTFLSFSGSRDKAQWVGEIRDRIEIHEAGTPQFRLNLWRQVFDSKVYQKLFSPHEEQIWSYGLPVTAEVAVNRACSKSYISVLSAGERFAVKVDVAAIVAKGQEKIWIDESCGIFEYPYQTLAVIAKRQAT
jgi:hypothetical protein